MGRVVFLGRSQGGLTRSAPQTEAQVHGHWNVKLILGERFAKFMELKEKFIFMQIVFEIRGFFFPVILIVREHSEDHSCINSRQRKT